MKVTYPRVYLLEEHFGNRYNQTVFTLATTHVLSNSGA